MAGKHKVRTTRGSSISVIVMCAGCDFRIEDDDEGSRKARRHTAKTGHTTSVQRSSYVHYNAIKEEETS